jgi:transposase
MKYPPVCSYCTLLHGFFQLNSKGDHHRCLPEASPGRQSMIEKYQCILTDPVRHRILDILPARYNHKLTEYFGQLDRSQTKHFVSDMWSTYAGIAQTYFKDSNYVIDKYHYIRQVFWAFEAVRKEEQKKFSKTRRIYFKRSRILLNKRYQFLTPEQKQQVDLMLYASNRLLTAYSLKEQFFKVLESSDSVSARTALSHWIMAAQNSEQSGFNILAPHTIVCCSYEIGK